MGYERRAFAGGAQPAALTQNVGTGDLVIYLSTTQGWPATATGPFYIVVDPNTATEEVMEVSAYTSSQATVTRGKDGTTAQAHSAMSSPSVYVCATAQDYDEANQVVNVLMGGQSSPATAAKVLDNLGAPDLNEATTQIFTGAIQTPAVTVTGSTLALGNAGAGGTVIQPTTGASTIYLRPNNGSNNDALVGTSGGLWQTYDGSGNVRNILDDGSGNIQPTGSLAPGNPGGGTTSQAHLFSGAGVPSNAQGVNGDFYFRTDTPGTANQRLYVKSAGSWVGIL